MTKYPILRIVEHLGANRVCLFFSSGKVVEIDLPWVTDASKAKIIHDGGALDPGNGLEVSSLALVEMPGNVLLPGDPGYAGYSRPKRKGQYKKS